MNETGFCLNFKKMDPEQRYEKSRLENFKKAMERYSPKLPNSDVPKLDGDAEEELIKMFKEIPDRYDDVTTPDDDVTTDFTSGDMAKFNKIEGCWHYSDCYTQDGDVKRGKEWSYSSGGRGKRVKMDILEIYVYRIINRHKFLEELSNFHKRIDLNNGCPLDKGNTDLGCFGGGCTIGGQDVIYISNIEESCIFEKAIIEILKKKENSELYQKFKNDKVYEHGIEDYLTRREEIELERGKMYKKLYDQFKRHKRYICIYEGCNNKNEEYLDLLGYIMHTSYCVEHYHEEVLPLGSIPPIAALAKHNNMTMDQFMTSRSDENGNIPLDSEKDRKTRDTKDVLDEEFMKQKKALIDTDLAKMIIKSLEKKERMKNVKIPEASYPPYIPSDCYTQIYYYFDVAMDEDQLKSFSRKLEAFGESDWHFDESLRVTFERYLNKDEYDRLHKIVFGIP